MKGHSHFSGRLIKQIVVFGFCVCGIAHAATDTSEDLYLDALRAISESRQEDAKAALVRLIEIEPQHAGAWLDLAIIHCELGNAKVAENLFRDIIVRFKPSAAITEVIAQRMEQGCKNKHINRRISVLLERGYDTNVNQGASNPNFGFGTGSTYIELPLLPEFLPKKDKFSSLTTSYMSELPIDGVIGFAQLKARRYDEQFKLNTLALTIGVEQPWQFRKWKASGTVMLGALTLNDHLYQKNELLQIRVTPPLNLPKSTQLNLITGLTRTQYPTLLDYDAVTWELRSQLISEVNGYRVQANLAYLSDRANGNRIGGNRIGELVSIQGRTKLSDQVFAEMDWTYQHWKSDKIYSPGLINQARNQHTHSIRAALNFPINQNQSLQLEVRKIKNRENISLFEFDSNVFQANWMWQGF